MPYLDGKEVTHEEFDAALKARAEALEMCACGEKLHYTNEETRRTMDQLVAEFGPNVVVTVGDKSWVVPRHYIALHGLKAGDADKLGFREATEDD